MRRTTNNSPITQQQSQFLITQITSMMEEYEKKVLGELLKQHKMSPAQFVQIVLSEVKRNPMMLEAFKKEPSSLFASIIYCAQLGLSPSAIAGEFYFLPFKGIVVKPIIGYKGLVSLMTRNNAVMHISAETVHGADVFEYELGLEPKLIHKPVESIRTSKNFLYVYVVAKLNNGEKVFKVMNLNEINSILATMDEVSPYYFNDAKDPMMWMIKKTCLKQLAKLLPKDYFGSEAISLDDKMEGNGYIVLNDEDKIEFKEGVKFTAKLPSKKNVYGSLMAEGKKEHEENDQKLLTSQPHTEEIPSENESNSAENDKDSEITPNVRFVKKRKKGGI
jgi:recombination protein RecT